jgi:hypothetical protein
VNIVDAVAFKTPRGTVTMTFDAAILAPEAVVTVADVAVYATFVTCATCGPKDENAQNSIFSDILALPQCDERHGSQHMQDTVPRRLFGSSRPSP